MIMGLVNPIYRPYSLFPIEYGVTVGQKRKSKVRRLFYDEQLIRHLHER